MLKQQNSRHVLRAVRMGLIFSAIVMTWSGCAKKSEHQIQEYPIRIGWQVSWATQGQLAEILQHTNALELNGLQGDFKSFMYGAPLSEAALSHQLDVAFIGDQPAINLLSRNTDWKIVARLMDFRVAIVVPFDSPFKSVADLKGKTLGIPFGASAHRVALQMLEEAGLDPTKDVKIVNVDIQEQSDMVKAGGGKSWPKIDAFASWDHNIALYESKSLARILKNGTALGVIVMSQKFIDADSDAAVGFLTAFKLAYYFYANNQGQADKWFSDATQGKFDLQILKDVASFEPNISRKELKDITIDFSPADATMLQVAADFAFKQGLIKSPILMSNFVLNQLAFQADKKISAELASKLEVVP